MCKMRLSMFAIGGLTLCLMMNQAASAQNLASFNGTPGYARPAVSPYLNLGLTANGLVNYQTLVKPLLDEQEALSTQATALARLQQQARHDQVGSETRDPYSRSRSVRFMNYSHFYGAR